MTKNKWMLIALSLMIVGCANQVPYDYSALRENPPRSILILPPLNNSIEVEADYKFLSTLSKPFAEKGYYVFPVSVVDAFLKENGLPTPAEMNAVPLDKLDKYIGPDAVLYTVIEDWGQKYQVIASTTVVKAKFRLLDVKSGELLWESDAIAEQSASDSGGGLGGTLAYALVSQVMSSMIDQTIAVSSIASSNALNNKSRGLLPGPYYVEGQSR